jgi:ferredoxin
MNIIIDKTKCTKCGKCAEECPASVIEINNYAEEVYPEFCNSCGHCAAVCSNNAIKCSEDNIRKPFKIQKIDQNLPKDQLLFHIKRSIRMFKNGKIDDDKIKEIINYGEKAPSSHNFRARKYIVISDPEDLKIIKIEIVKSFKFLITIILNPFLLAVLRIFNKKAHKELTELKTSFKKMIKEYQNGKDKIFRNAVCIICVAAPLKSRFSKDDCIAAQHYMMLYGKTINIDSFIVGYAQQSHKVVEKFCKLDKSYSIFSVSAFGYGKHKYANEVLYKEPEILWKHLQN